MYRPTPLPGFVESRYDMADVDILEPLGYQRLMARVKMAWIEAGVPWSAPNLNLSTSEYSHHWRLTNGQVPAANSHCHIPSITGSSSSKDVAVRQPCGRQDVSIHVAGLMPSQASSFHKFPAELMLEILEHVSTSDLRSFALSSTIYNDLAGRRLWRKFVIAGNSTEEVTERCTALLRVPSRAGRVRSLVVGRGRWTWTPDLLHLFQRIWPTLPRLVDLTLNNPHFGFGRCMTRLGCSLEPLIRGLLLHAQSFRLRSFTYGGWLWPQSPLHMFLCTQPSIEELYGVDVFATRPLPHSPQFLPFLRALGCLRVETALFFLPNCGIHKLCVSEKIARDSDLILLTEALEACNGALNELSLSVLQWPPQDQLGRFTKLLCQVRMLILGGYSNFSSPFPFTLPALEELECMQVVRGYEADPARLPLFASQFGPKLRRVFFYARGECHTWLKEDGTEWVVMTPFLGHCPTEQYLRPRSQFYLATGSVPQRTIVYV